MFKEVKRTFAGRELSMETGRLAKQAAGAVLVQFGDNVVLAAVSVSDKISHLPFFPLTVEFREKWYAAGKFPGGFIKREGRPNDGEILSARQIDRSLRPLFPKGFKNETQVFVYVLSADQENDADTVGLTAASLALSLSKVPWDGPVAAVRLGRVDGEWVVNPTFDQLDESDLDLVVAGRRGSIMMVEGGAIDWVSHNKDAAGTAGETLAFDEAVQVALDFANEDGETLLVVTADHETGGLTLGDNMNLACLGGITATTDFIFGTIMHETMDADMAMDQFARSCFLPPNDAFDQDDLDLINLLGEMGISDILSERIGVSWNGIGMDEGDHTLTEVPVFAIGPGSELFDAPNFDNTDVGQLLLEAVSGN